MTATKTSTPKKAEGVKATTGTKIFVRQLRSSARTRQPHVRTLLALGLGRPGKTNTLPDNRCVRGMIRSVVQWLEVRHV